MIDIQHSYSVQYTNLMLAKLKFEIHSQISDTQQHQHNFLYIRPSTFISTPIFIIQPSFLSNMFSPISVLFLTLLFSLTLAQKNGNCPINSVCFAVDHSGSISGTEYLEEITFVKGIANAIGKRTTNARYSAYGFASSSFIMQAGTTDLKTTFNPTIMNFPKSFGGTNMRAGLQACFDEVRGNKGNRLIVLVTDGEDTSLPDALDLAPTVKNAGVSIVTVGVGSGANEQYLKDLATSPKFFVQSSDFSTLLDSVIDVVEDSCSVVQSPKPTAKPVKTQKPSKSPKPTRLPKDSCGRAARRCDFKFAGSGSSVPTFSATGKPDVAFTNLIVARSSTMRLGVLNSNGVVPEFILANGVVRKITAFATPRYTPTHFKPFTIKKRRGSGIGHQTYTGSQKKNARRRCIRVFFTHFQKFVGGNLENVNVAAGDRSKCVVFRTA